MPDPANQPVERNVPGETQPPSLSERFSHAASATAHAVGSPWAFLMAVGTIVVGGLSGPLFGFSDTWQLVINTGTTIVTFLMVFLIQNTQNRDAKALHLKLDELLRAVDAARNDLIDIEEDSTEELEELQATYRELHKQAVAESPATAETAASPRSRAS
jgi:low affinity Fe/Cu permease